MNPLWFDVGPASHVVLSYLISFMPFSRHLAFSKSTQGNSAPFRAQHHLATQPLNHSAKVTEINWRIDGVASLVGRTFAHVEIQPRFDQKTSSSFSRRLGGSFMKLHFLVVDVESSCLPSQVSYATMQEINSNTQFGATRFHLVIEKSTS